MYITRSVLWELERTLLSIYPENIRQMTLHWTAEMRLALEGSLLVLSTERRVEYGPPCRARVGIDSFIQRGWFVY